MLIQQFINAVQGRIQDIKLGGAQLKKLRRAEGGAKILGVFRVKNHDCTPKNHIFPMLGGCPPGSAPAVKPANSLTFIKKLCIIKMSFFFSSCHRKFRMN